MSSAVEYADDVLLLTDAIMPIKKPTRAYHLVGWAYDLTVLALLFVVLA